MPNDEYWKRKLDELELDMSAKKSGASGGASGASGASGDRPTEPLRATPEPSNNPNTTDAAPDLGSIYQQSRAWFSTLPAPGKGIVVLGGGILALSVVRTLVQVVTFGLSIGLFVILAYGAYRFLGNRDSSGSP